MAAYSKNTWVARIGTGLNRYRDQNDNVYEFTPDPTEIVEGGTPFSADWMNHIEEGIYNASLNVVGYAVSDQSSATISVNMPNWQGIPLTAGQVFIIDFQSHPYTNATLNINNTGAKPLYNVFPYAPIVKGDVPPGYIAFVAYDGTNYVVLNRAWESPSKPAGSQFFSSSGTFTVPANVYAINVSACAAGIGRNAGEWIIDTVYQVTPGQQISITVGTGNTVIGSLKTLVAGSKAQSTHSTKMGYATGYNGGSGGGGYGEYGGYGGYGGAFGYGGGGGGWGNGLLTWGGGGGAGKGGNGVSAQYGEAGEGGGTTGGKGGLDAAGENAKEGSIVYAGGSAGTSTYNGGGGTVYGAGGGGSSKNDRGGCGGGAGGYGAGCGTGGQNYDNTLGTNGTPAKGCALIEWGPTYA